CHMDTISRPLMQGMPNRMAHRHWFPGSGIPKRAGIETKGLSGMAFYPDQLQKQYGADDSITYEIKLVNEEAGHRLPTGDPERFYLIELQWTDIANDTIIQQETFRIGETWEWYPEARKLSDNNLNPKESRVFSITMMPHDPGQYRLKVLVTKHRMDDKTAVYNKLGDEYPLFIEVFSEEQVIEIK
ncbi:MAG: hypothetical protein KDC53_01490, partial [Saprospiraceae bacterium]|nr:hypothetical protein [Saprospiraceae bacterium]